MSIFRAIFNGIGWILATGWKLWASLFAWLPYGDPFIAIFAAMMVGYWVLKILNPPGGRY